MSIFSKAISKQQSCDTGMAMVLLCLIENLATHQKAFLLGAVILLILDMTVPKIYGPLAVLWFGLSELLATVVSKILLSIVYFAIITPFGLVRRLLGKDSLQLRAFKAATTSAMLERNHTFTRVDIERPY